MGVQTQTVITLELTTAKQLGLIRLEVVRRFEEVAGQLRQAELCEGTTTELYVLEALTAALFNFTCDLDVDGYEM